MESLKEIRLNFDAKSNHFEQLSAEVDDLNSQLMISQAENQKICDLNSKLNANIEISKTKGINYKKQIENLKNDLNNVFNNNYILLKNRKY